MREKGCGGRQVKYVSSWRISFKYPRLARSSAKRNKEGATCPLEIPFSLSLSLFISKERNRVSFLRAWRNDGRFEEQPCALRREEKEEEEKKFRSGILDKPYFRLIYFARENPRFLFTPRGDNRIQVSVDDSCDANARGSVGEMKRVEMLSDRFDGFVTRLTCTKNISKDD